MAQPRTVTRTRLKTSNSPNHLAANQKVPAVKVTAELCSVDFVLSAQLAGSLATA